MSSAYLSAHTRAWMLWLLPAQGSKPAGDMELAAKWPDTIKDQYHWTSSLHYVNVPDGECTYNRTRDCPTYAPKSNPSVRIPLACVDGAVLNYTRQLRSGQFDGRQLTAQERTDALRFLIHYLGGPMSLMRTQGGCARERKRSVTVHGHLMIVLWAPCWQ